MALKGRARIKGGLQSATDFLIYSFAKKCLKQLFLGN